MEDELFPNGIQSSTTIPRSSESSRGFRWGFLGANVLGVAVFTTAMAGAGAYIGSHLEKDDVREAQEFAIDIQYAQNNLDNTNALLLEVEVEIDDLGQTYGQTCVSALRQYFDDQLLITTPDDSIVKDIVADPQQPCGKKPTQVRKNLAVIKDAMSIHTGLKDYPSAEIMQTIDQMRSELEGMNKTSDAHAGAWILGIFGLAVGCFGSRIAYEESDGGRR